MTAARVDRKRAELEERRVETPALVDRLIRLDREEDHLLARAAEEARSAEHAAARAQMLVVAAKRIDAQEDETIALIRANERARGALEAALGGAA